MYLYINKLKRIYSFAMLFINRQFLIFFQDAQKVSKNFSLKRTFKCFNDDFFMLKRYDGVF